MFSDDSAIDHEFVAHCPIFSTLCNTFNHMLLAIDVGNSEITIGVWDRQWTQHWRISSREDQPPQFYALKVRDFFLEADIAVRNVKTIVLSSVVPTLTTKIETAFATLLQKSPIVLGPDIYQKLPIGVLNPYEIGSDLVANAVAAYNRFKNGVIVVDFGTALTFTTISPDGVILGVSIVPGLQTAIRSLSDNTAKLFEVPLELPRSVLGKSTITAIQTGIILGYEGLVKNVVEHIRSELGSPYPAIATGGLSSVITALHPFFEIVEPKLTLDGLRLIGEAIEH